MEWICIIVKASKDEGGKLEICSSEIISNQEFSFSFNEPVLEFLAEEGKSLLENKGWVSLESLLVLFEEELWVEGGDEIWDCVNGWVDEPAGVRVWGVVAVLDWEWAQDGHRLAQHFPLLLQGRQLVELEFTTVLLSPPLFETVHHVLERHLRSTQQ